MFSSPPNIKVGMPKTADMPKNYGEFVVRADQPLTVEMTFVDAIPGVTYRCGPIAVTFKPEIDKYYDTSLQINDRKCRINVRQLNETASGMADPVLVNTTPANACTK